MNKSETIAALAAALAKAQPAIKVAVKDSVNPHFRSKFADLSSVWDAVRDALKANGLAVVQFPISDENGYGVETILLHASGEYLSERFTMPAVKKDPQGAGSCITYAKRYGLQAVLGVCADEDDDANAAVAAVLERKERNANRPRTVDATNADAHAAATALEAAALLGTDQLRERWTALHPEVQAKCKPILDGLRKVAAGVDARKAGAV